MAIAAWYDDPRAAEAARNRLMRTGIASRVIGSGERPTLTVADPDAERATEILSSWRFRPSLAPMSGTPGRWERLSRIENIGLVLMSAAALTAVGLMIWLAWVLWRGAGALGAAGIGLVVFAIWFALVIGTGQIRRLRLSHFPRARRHRPE